MEGKRDSLAELRNVYDALTGLRGEVFGSYRMGLPCDPAELPERAILLAQIERDGHNLRRDAAEALVHYLAEYDEAQHASKTTA